ncbi:hypothetical protein [Haloarchaeobius sp. HME9146]|uniref:hypothetical protein n=1 Tax=Haloarchaeobius sp. HME9146 TaxID=2978732 RepID=UPI0021BDF689|nr:hypothetical protein [Haloarchaeobius sp. HME9146]MCT9097522.1 hypothetical protein [Haloarchaeobius sp. HME9146]
MGTSSLALPRRLLAASLVTLVLATLAAGAGLLVPSLYRDSDPLLPQLYGQDFLTLTVAVPALAVALLLAARGSVRGYVAWLGVTGYLLYTYASYAVMTAFNPLYLVYVALFGLALFTLAAGVARLDPDVVRRQVGDGPVRAAVAYQVVVALLVGVLWLADVVPASISGTIPAAIENTGLVTPVIQSLDLAVLLPAFALSAYWLWRGRAWGYAFTAVLLVKATTLGLAVLAMVAVMLRDGQPVSAPQIVVFVLLSVAGLAVTGWFLRAIGPDSDATRTATVTADSPGH